MNAPHDRDELTREEAVVLYHELEQRARALPTGSRRQRPGRPRVSLSPRRWALLSPIAVGLAIASVVAANSLTAPTGVAPSGGAASANGPLAATGQPPLVLGERVRSITRQGTTTTVTYRSGLIEVVTLSSGIVSSTNSGPETVGSRSIAVTAGSQRITLTGVDPARLREAARMLVRS